VCVCVCEKNIVGWREWRMKNFQHNNIDISLNHFIE
jgi:hypothetical protein